MEVEFLLVQLQHEENSGVVVAPVNVAINDCCGALRVCITIGIVAI